MRMRDTCIQCARPDVEIVSNGLCRNCNQKYWRWKERQQREEAEGTVGVPKPDRSQKRYQLELSEQIAVLIRAQRSLEKTAFLEVALPKKRLDAIIADFNQAIRVLNNAKKVNVNQNSEFTVNPDELSGSLEELTENPNSELTVNSEPEDEESSDETRPH